MKISINNIEFLSEIADVIRLYVPPSDFFFFALS